MTELPGIVVQAAAALGLDPAGLGRLRGASGSSWDAGSGVLRVGRREVLDRELACRFMLADLASRYPPAGLAPIRAALDQLA